MLLFFVWIVLLIGLLIVALDFFPFLFTSSGTQLTSTDWSGYVVYTDFASPQPLVYAINGSWNVPNITITATDSYSAAWIGIGGQFDDTLIQLGTEHDSVGGLAQYSAWYELLPADSITINMSISAGDTMIASIRLLNLNTNLWSINMLDITNGQHFEMILTYGSTLLSGEWIVERPTVGNVIGPLAEIGPVTFTNTTATLDASTGRIVDFSYSHVLMVNRQNTRLVDVSSLSSDGQSFTVTKID